MEDTLTRVVQIVTPYAANGVIAAALVLALSRLPLLNCVALSAACVCLAALLSAGDASLDVAMAMVLAGGASGLILVASGGALWRRPALRRIWEKSTAAATQQAPAGRQSLAFRLAAVAVVALSVQALAPLAPAGRGLEQATPALWLAAMGLFAALSAGSALVSASGFLALIAATTLLVPPVVAEEVLQPLAYGAIGVVMILAALGFSFAAPLREHDGASGLSERPQTSSQSKAADSSGTVRLSKP